jgi:hypothetical protein
MHGAFVPARPLPLRTPNERVEPTRRGRCRDDPTRSKPTLGRARLASGCRLFAGAAVTAAPDEEHQLDGRRDRLQLPRRRCGLSAGAGRHETRVIGQAWTALLRSYRGTRHHLVAVGHLPSAASKAGATPASGPSSRIEAGALATAALGPWVADCRARGNGRSGRRTPRQTPTLHPSGPLPTRRCLDWSGRALSGYRKSPPLPGLRFA